MPYFTAFIACASAVLLAGCAHRGPQDWERSTAPGVTRAAFRSCPATERPALCAEVVPRLGLFNHYLYRGANSPAPSGGQDDELAYGRALPPQLAELLGSIGAWEMLTTHESQSGYGSRKVNLALRGVPESAACTFRFRMQTASPAGWHDLGSVQGPCGGTAFRLPTNLAAEACATTTQGADCFVPAGRGAEAVTLIPEDVLVVSIGDSFGAGEGNPDVSAGAKGPARWMDDRCHRSAWAGAIRAGLVLARESLAQPEKGSPSRAAGAVTVASVSCSGATITAGLVGTYEGILPLSELASRNRLVNAQFDENLKILESAVPLQPQVRQVVKLLESQDPALAKRSVDTLLVSVGGNDALFAKLIELFIRRNITVADLAPYSNFMGPRFKDVRDWYGQLRSAIAVRPGEAPPPFSLSVEPDHVLITQYPTPALKRDGDAYAYCGELDGGIITALMGTFGFSINEHQFPIIDQCVVEPLNRTVKDAARSNRWHYVDGISASFAGHGFCAKGTASDAYAAQERWFRSVDDTLAYQGNANGLFHPTWEGQGAYGERLFASLKAGRQAQVRFRLDGTWPGEGTTYLGRETSVIGEFDPAVIPKVADPIVTAKPSYAQCDGLPAWPVQPEPGAALEMHVFRTPDGPLPDQYCQPGGTCALSALFAASGPAVVRVETRHPGTQRKFHQTFANVFVDLDPPVAQCARVAGGDAASPVTLPCAAGEWIREGRLLVSADDPKPGSGLKSCSWAIGAGPARSCAEPVTALPQGEFALVVEAKDQVNPAVRTRFDLKADSVDPAVVSYAVLGAEVGAGEPVVIPVRRVSDAPLRAEYAVEFRVADATSGPSRFSVASPSLQADYDLKPRCDPRAVGIGRLTDEVHAWRSADQVTERVSVIVSDCAGRTSEIAATAVLLGAGSGVLSGAKWRQEIAGGAHPGVRRVGAMSRRYRDPASVGAGEWALYAAWLNFADGRVAGDAAVGFGWKECAAGPGGGTVYAFLREAEACAAKRGGDAAWWESLAATLVAANLVVADAP